MTQPAQPGRDDRQRAALAWAVEMFGPVALKTDERAARLVEEAIEVVQSVGLSIGVVRRILDRVYSRPPGVFAQEVGGLAITLDCLAETQGVSVKGAGDREFDRISSLSKDFWTKKHQEKVTDGVANLSGPGEQS